MSENPIDNTGTNAVGSSAEPSKKPLISIVLLVCVLVIGAFAAYYFNQNQQANLCSSSIESAANSPLTIKTDKVELRSTDNFRLNTQVVSLADNHVMWERQEADNRFLDGVFISGEQVLVGTFHFADDASFADDHTLTAYSLVNGNELWSYKTYDFIAKPPAIKNGTAYLVTQDFGGQYGGAVGLVALDLATGKELGKSDPSVQLSANVQPAPVVTDKFAYVLDYKIYAFDLETHQLKWAFDPRSFLEDYEIRNFQANDKLVGFDYGSDISGSGRSYRLDATTGRKLAECK